LLSKNRFGKGTASAVPPRVTIDSALAAEGNGQIRETGLWETILSQDFRWRKRVGVEPTNDGIARRSPVLKTGTITGPHALPYA
jgi:hypothetical protein